MFKYAKVENEETGLCSIALGDDIQTYRIMGMEPLDVELSDVDNSWYLKEKCPHKSEEEKEREERERIGNLEVTKRVFMLGLQQMGITYSQLKELLATNDQAQMEWDLCVELQRKNPLLDTMAAQFGVSSQMLDYIFRKANGEEVDPPRA